MVKQTNILNMPFYYENDYILEIYKYYWFNYQSSYLDLKINGKMYIVYPNTFVVFKHQPSRVNTRTIQIFVSALHGGSKLLFTSDAKGYKQNACVHANRVPTSVGPSC